MLDDNRIVAAHAELHYILNALERGGGIWYLHPETQRFHGQEVVLKAMHELVVAEMSRRKFNHSTPVTLEDLPEELNLIVPESWIHQDLADLYRKWESEGRWDDQGFFHYGALKFKNILVGETKQRIRAGFHPPRDQDMVPPFRDMMRVMAEKLPHREWTKEDSQRLKQLVEERDKAKE